MLYEKDNYEHSDSDNSSDSDNEGVKMIEKGTEEGAEEGAEEKAEEGAEIRPMMKRSYVSAKEIINRMKDIADIRSDIGLSNKLGLTHPSIISKWRINNFVSPNAMYEFINQYKINLHWLAYGVGPNGQDEHIGNTRINIETIRQFPELAQLIIAASEGDLTLMQEAAWNLSQHLTDLRNDEQNDSDRW